MYEREKTLSLLKQYTETDSLLKHAYAVEASMIGYAKKWDEPVDEWAAVGLLHDIDYEKYPEEHPLKGVEILKEAGYPDGFSATIKLPAIYSYSKRAGEVIADQLSKVGIKLTIEIVEWGQWIDRIFKKKEYQLTMIGHVEAWDIGIYAKPDYYFQYDSQEFRDAYAKALQAPDEVQKAEWFGRCQEIVADDAVNGFLFSAPNLPAMKAGVMGWWENYPTVALDCTAVWWQP